MYDLAKNFQIFFKICCLHYFISKDMWWRAKIILRINLHINAPQGYRDDFLLIGPSFAEKRVWFIQELPNFLQKYVAYTILSRKKCDGEQKLFLRINLHINAHKNIETIFADWTVSCWKSVYDLAKNFQIFFKNMLLTLFYLERHVMESKHYFLELVLILICHKCIEKIFADWTVFCWKTCMI